MVKVRSRVADPSSMHLTVASRLGKNSRESQCQTLLQAISTKISPMVIYSSSIPTGKNVSIEKKSDDKATCD